MWTLLTNPIITHLLAAFAGAGGAWYATHKTAVKTAVSTAEATVDAAVSAVKSDVAKV